jgi:hypothetical protein
MSRSLSATLGLALLAVLAAPAVLAASSQATRKHVGKKASKQAAEAPRPPLPEELPPVAPTVTYRRGLLTIVAENSTLQDILTGVGKATGATVDAPATSASERVATRLGPGQPRDVLAALLNGSRFDYILLGSPENPGGIRRLILSPRTGGASARETSSSPTGPFFSQSVRPAPAARTPLPEADEGENEVPEETVEPAQEVAPEPEPPVPAPQPELKTPQQMQEEFLRRQQEQQPQPLNPPQPPQ